MASNSISFRGTNSGVQVGINHGPIYPPIERPETPPVPLLICPFRRDPDFVDRGALLEQIYQEGCAPAARIALVGLGGVGKSQLAIECCYRVEERSPQTWVFWIHAANAERFEKSCCDIANRLKIPGRNDPKAKVFALIHNWLSDKRNGKWVVILDNVDDSRFLHEIPADPNRQEDREASRERSLLECFPVANNGSIIITSRSRDAVDSIVEPSDTIAIGPMNESDAAELFAKKLGEPFTQDANQLIRELDYMPLAIVQAAAHIRHRAPRLSVSQYLRKFQKGDYERISLLKHEKGQLRRDKEAKNSILVTWQISFDYIQQIHPEAADVLSFMCMFDRQGIPESLLRYNKRNPDHDHNTHLEKSCNSLITPKKVSSSSKGDISTASSKATCVDQPDSDLHSVHSTDNEFEELISTLRDYSLISIDADDAAFEMHRLVQLAMRQWLEAHDELELWKQYFTDILLVHFLHAQWKEWHFCQVLLPHVLSAVTQPPAEERSLGRWAQLVQVTASFALERGDYARSEELARLAFNTRNSLFGPKDEKTIQSLALMGQATQHSGKWKDAEQLYHQVIEAYTQISGPENPATLTGMLSLAWVYWQQGRWKDAEEIQLQVLEARKRILGTEHPDTLTAMNNLALSYQDQGRLTEAGEIQSQVSEARKRILGTEHLDTLTAMNNLAHNYQDQGRWNEAEEIQSQVLEARKGILGPEHPDTLTVMNNLAITYGNQGQWKQAEEMKLQVLEKYKRILGLDHPDTLVSARNLALTYCRQGRWNEAEELQVQVLKDQQRILGLEHPDTLASMCTLALTYCQKGRWNEAEELQVHVLKDHKRILGPEHPDTLLTMGNLAVTYWRQGRWDEAEELQVQVLKDHKRILGPEHPETLTGIGNLAMTYWRQGRWDEAEELQVQLLKDHKRILGPDHPETLDSMASLASIYRGHGRWNEARELAVQVLKDRRRILGPEHPLTLKCMEIHALTLWSLDQDSSAISLMADCARLRIRILGPEHPDTIDATRILDEWRETKKISCSRDTGSPPEASGEAFFKSSSEGKQRKSQYTVSQEDPPPSRRRKREIFSRLFRSR